MSELGADELGTGALGASEPASPELAPASVRTGVPRPPGWKAVAAAAEARRQRAVEGVVAGGRHPPRRHARGPRRDLDRLQPPVRRRLPHGPQPVEPVGPELVDRRHGDGHGADHRVAQHRPVGRLVARLPRLHAWRWSRPTGSSSFFGLNIHASSLQGTALVWLIAIAFGVAARCPVRQRHRVHHRLRRRARLHRHPRRVPRLARHHLPRRRQEGPDPRPARQHVPAARRRHERSGTNGALGAVAELDPGPPRLRGHRGQHLPGPPASPALRPGRAADVGRRRARRPRVRWPSSSASASSPTSTSRRSPTSRRVSPTRW